jgi:beta-lactam-binding protein with PASTA domain
VLSQVPPAGQPIERGSVVLAYLAAPQDSVGRSLPDLVGLPVREAMRRLTQRAVPVRISGSGFVTRQSPAPGTKLPLAGPCRLWCSPTLPEASGAVRTRTSAALASATPGQRARRP